MKCSSVKALSHGFYSPKICFFKLSPLFRAWRNLHFTNQQLLISNPQSLILSPQSTKLYRAHTSASASIVKSHPIFLSIPSPLPLCNIPLISDYQELKASFCILQSAAATQVQLWFPVRTLISSVAKNFHSYNSFPSRFNSSY